MAAPFDVTSLTVTPAARAAIAALPQGTPGWLKSRENRLTASNFGCAAGHNALGTRAELLRAMLWPATHGALQGFAAQMAAYGTRNEPVARDLYVNTRATRDGDAFVARWETGLLVSLEHGWLGCSPDIVVAERNDVPAPPEMYTIDNDGVDPESGQHVPHMLPCTDGLSVTVGCGEIKCPATRKQYHDDPKHAATGGIPWYYVDQMQGVMALNGWPWCDFIVYTPPITTVHRVFLDMEYWTKELFPALHMFYFDMFLPRLNARLAGLLRPGEIDIVYGVPKGIKDDVDVDDDDDKDNDDIVDEVKAILELLQRPKVAPLL